MWKILPLGHYFVSNMNQKYNFSLPQRLLFGVFESSFDNEFVIKSYAMESDSSGAWKTVTSGLTNTNTSTCEYFKRN